MNLDRLQKIAEAATPGPWFYESDGRQELRNVGHYVKSEMMRFDELLGGYYYPTIVHGNTGEPDARYIAACSPDVVLRLIAIARAAQTVMDPNAPFAKYEWSLIALRSALANLDAQQEPT